MSATISGVSAATSASLRSVQTVQPDPVKLAEVMISQNRSAGKGIQYGALLRDLDQLHAKDPDLAAQVEEAVKAQLGVNGTKFLMAASYTIGSGDKALTISRTAPSYEQYFRGTAHAKLAKTPAEKVAYAQSDKAHYAKLDKMFGDGNAKTFEGAKIEQGVGDMLRRGFNLNQSAEYKAVLAAEAKAATPVGQGPSTTTVVLDLTQMALDLTGIVDPSPISDGSNAIISLGRGISDAFSGEWKSAGGNLANGLISAVGIVPYLGDLAKAGKVVGWAKTISNTIEMMAKNPALVKKLEPMLREIRDLVNKLPQSAIDALPADAKKAIESMKTKLDEALGAGSRVFSDGVKKIAERLGIPAEQVQKIIDLGRGNRPNPSSYMTKSQIAEHLAKFDDGAVRFTSRASLAKRGTLGPPGGFVMPASEFSELMKAAKGDLRIVEKKLSLDSGYLSSSDTMIAFIEKKDIKGLKIPSGNEGGAHEVLWRPGGYTLGGVSEAVMDFLTSTPYKEIKL